MSLLHVRDVTKRFGGLTAVDDVSFDVHDGMIKAIIGPNGAGKSTLFNVLTAYERADEGAISFDGDDLGDLKPHKIVKLGVARTFQNTQLFDEMTAIDNVLVGMYPRTKTGMIAASLRLPSDAQGGAPVARRRRCDCCDSWDSRTMPARRQRTCPTDTGACSRSLAPWPRSLASCCSMSRPLA